MDFVLNRLQYKFQLDEKSQRAFLVTPFEKVSRRARVANMRQNAGTVGPHQFPSSLLSLFL